MLFNINNFTLVYKVRHCLCTLSCSGSSGSTVALRYGDTAHVVGDVAALVGAAAGGRRAAGAEHAHVCRAQCRAPVPRAFPRRARACSR